MPVTARCRRTRHYRRYPSSRQRAQRGDQGPLMNTDIAALRAALDARQREVAQAERELAALRTELDAFAREYNARAGARQARLEALEAEIAELRRRPPGYRQV